MDNNFPDQKYQLLKVLAHGAFSTVHLAINRENGQKCIIKEIIIKKHDLTKLEIFEKEAHVLARIKNPNIPSFYDFFKVERAKEIKTCLVQQYIEGNSLADMVREHNFFNEEEVLEIALDLSGVLEYLHGFSPPLIHRDIKPENIIYTRERKVYLIDFGAVLGEDLFEKMQVQGLSTIIGTQSYMPLEQLRGHTVMASDIYSLGLSLIFLLSHKAPQQFESRGLDIDFLPHINVSKATYKLLRKMIETDWKKRYHTATELKKEILKLLDKIYKNNTNSPYDKIFSKYSGMFIPGREIPSFTIDSENITSKGKAGTNLEVLESENPLSTDNLLKKIAYQENISVREQELLIALTVNKIPDERDRYEIISSLIKNPCLENEIIKILIGQISHSFSDPFFIREIFINLHGHQNLSATDQLYLINMLSNSVKNEEILLEILKVIISYRFAGADIISVLLRKTGTELKSEKNKKCLFELIAEKHKLSPADQKLFIVSVLENFSVEEIKVSLLNKFVEVQQPDARLALFLAEQVELKIISETNRQSVFNSLKI